MRWIAALKEEDGNKIMETRGKAGLGLDGWGPHTWGFLGPHWDGITVLGMGLGGNYGYAIELWVDGWPMLLRGRSASKQRGDECGYERWRRR